MRPELFLLSAEVLDAIDRANIDATYKDMRELGINKMPYELVDVAIPALALKTGDRWQIHPHHHHDSVTCKGCGQHGGVDCAVKFCYRNGELYRTLCKSSDDVDWTNIHKEDVILDEDLLAGEVHKRILVVLLATKNIVKTRTKDKLAALGIGKAKKDPQRPIYTTTLSLPAASDLPTETSTPRATGVALRPHLRRGHIRHQRHGPRYEFIKKIWIEPCFVNADENFVSARENYNANVTHLRKDHANEPVSIQDQMPEMR